LNKLLNTQQKSPAGNIHSASVSLNIAIKRKINAATANPTLEITNKMFNLLSIVEASLQF